MFMQASDRDGQVHMLCWEQALLLRYMNCDVQSHGGQWLPTQAVDFRLRRQPCGALSMIFSVPLGIQLTCTPLPADAAVPRRHLLRASIALHSRAGAGYAVDARREVPGLQARPRGHSQPELEGRGAGAAPPRTPMDGQPQPRKIICSVWYAGLKAQHLVNHTAPSLQVREAKV